ncbi:MAG: hypothetical protein N4A44_00115 [Alphaproteobacteria bacterium]|jgi:hypothetical protein|nr:hypothetical protein [Alphaproteobacteria bacterium]
MNYLLNQNLETNNVSVNDFLFLEVRGFKKTQKGIFLGWSDDGLYIIIQYRRNVQKIRSRKIKSVRVGATAHIKPKKKKYINKKRRLKTKNIAA